ncbi:MAG: DNA-binding NtrC family response regulator [Candidatus Azotimanducaceae bacterium]|jgi:DNA-binding NtrC family response regulator
MVQSDNVPSSAARNKDWCQKSYVLNILIVDDDALHGRSVRDLLAAHNCLADVESSGHGGLDRLLQAEAAGTPYQVLIPDLAVIDVLAKIQSRQLNVKTIILSGEEQLELKVVSWWSMTKYR